MCTMASSQVDNAASTLGTAARASATLTAVRVWREGIPSVAVRYAAASGRMPVVCINSTMAAPYGQGVTIAETTSER